MEMSEVFWSFLVTSVIACGLGTLRMAYKSKCKKFTFCGLVVERDTDGEEVLDAVQLQRINSNEVV